MKSCLLIILLSFCGIVGPVDGQADGFVSLNCGGPDYSDLVRGIDYTSDEKYIASGVPRKISRKLQQKHKNDKRFWSLRSFPKGYKNCYNFFKLRKGDTFLFRSEFFYGDHDDLKSPPQFEVHVGTVYKDNVVFRPPKDRLYRVETIHRLRTHSLQICLVKTGSSIPFISSLELRLIENGAYNSTGVLQLLNRYDLGSSNSRGIDDVYDRYPWEQLHDDDWVLLRTTFEVRSSTYEEPQGLMSTAIVPSTDNQSITIESSYPLFAHNYIYVYFYFAEIIKLRNKELREFSIYEGDKVLVGTFRPHYLQSTVIPLILPPSENGSINLHLKKTNSSTYAPILNGLEVYAFHSFMGDEKLGTNRHVRTILVTVFSCVLVIFAIALLIFFKNRKKQHQQDLTLDTSPPPPTPSSPTVTKREFNYSEIETITTNFSRVIGRGGSGLVYHGVLSGQEVAVKLLDRSATHACSQFKAEVEVLLRVHHRNLVALKGYCEQGDCLALIYEYLAHGDLKDRLSGKSGHFLSWENRLRIATQIAQGIEYLHHACNPPIIHRDVKSRNILLNPNLEAKLGDFGLSKSLPNEEETHIWTVVAGTRGYLDPAYTGNNQLTLKSDVFSYGVVLLELITNQNVSDNEREWRMLTDWVSAKFERGQSEEIVDSRLNGQFDGRSMQKTIDIALACTNQARYDRPSMKQVTLQLSECLELEKARAERVQWSESLIMPR